MITQTFGQQIFHSIASNGTISYPTGLFYGVCSHPWALTERDCQEMKKLGVKYLRIDFMGPPLDYGQCDQIVQWAKENGLQIVALLQGDPTIPSGVAFDSFVSQFGQFVHEVVVHYNGNITYFEIWNEPNTIGAWNDSEATLYNGFYIRGKAIAKYVELLKEAYTQAKSADPNSQIISGGIANDWIYLQGMYDNGVKGYFDYLGLHPYFNHSPTKNYDRTTLTGRTPISESSRKSN